MSVQGSHGRLTVVDRPTLARRIAQTCRLEGDFLLRSGQRASFYFDKYLFEAKPDLLRAVGEQAASLVPPGIEVLAGLELGGVPVAVALSFQLGLPAAFVRKQAKGYGTAKLAEGADVAGRRVLVVEDVVTTGGQVLQSVRELRDLGAVVDTIVCVIDRSTQPNPSFPAAGLELRALFTLDDLEVE
jgi:orotate phosphoribosyltransferase